MDIRKQKAISKNYLVGNLRYNQGALNLLAKDVEIIAEVLGGDFMEALDFEFLGFVNRVFGSNRRHIENKIVDGLAIEIETSISNTIRSINKDG